MEAPVKLFWILKYLTPSEEIEVTMVGNPEISCLTGYAQPETNTLDGYEYTWSGPSIPSANSDEINPQLTDAGTYNLTVINPDSGCSTTSQFVVLPQPEIETGIEEQIRASFISIRK
jgi:hypothetical protein